MFVHFAEDNAANLVRHDSAACKGTGAFSMAYSFSFLFFKRFATALAASAFATQHVTTLIVVCRRMGGAEDAYTQPEVIVVLPTCIRKTRVKSEKGMPFTACARENIPR